jgi:hypothetical protein
MSALRHCQVGDKQEWIHSMDYVITEFPTRVNVYILLGEMWSNVGETQKVLLYSLVNGDVALIAVQLQHNDKLSNCVMLYCLYKLYCSGRLEEVHKVIAVAT